LGKREVQTGPGRTIHKKEKYISSGLTVLSPVKVRGKQCPMAEWAECAVFFYLFNVKKPYL